MPRLLTDHITDHGVVPDWNGEYANGTEIYTSLSPFYVRVLPINDQWGTPYLIYTRTNASSQWGAAYLDGSALEMKNLSLVPTAVTAPSAPTTSMLLTIQVPVFIRSKTFPVSTMIWRTGMGPGSSVLRAEWAPLPDPGNRLSETELGRHPEGCRLFFVSRFPLSLDFSLC